MKIGILSREFPPLTHVGGIATYSAAAADLLARNGHEVHVVCNGPKTEIVSRRGVTVHRVAMLDHHFSGGKLFYPYRSWYRRVLPHYLDALTWARTAARYLETALDPSGFDAWEYPETSGEGAFFPHSRGAKKPRLVCRVHTSWMDAYADNLLERRLLLGLQRRACLRSDLLVSPSEFMAGDYVRKTLKVGREVKVNRNPLLLWNQPIDWSAKRATNLLCVGRVEHRKGLQVLLKALDELGPEAAGVTLRVVGHMYPPTRELDVKCIDFFESHRSRKTQSRGRGFELEYAGPCEHSLMYRHYDWAGVLIMPSLMENYPYAALEGLSRGCYLLGSDVGGIPEIIDRPSRGMLFPAENSAFLAQKIRECIHRIPVNPGGIEIPENMREVAAEIGTEFAPEACALRLLETYGPNFLEGNRR
ncbi:MAG: glycosyltransferase family 4 protein [Fibrobacterota bacterium]|nr:glycosyltransferase family 4 protein [Fibrobacterota bacterium]